MATTTRHEEISSRFLDQADEEFEKGDMLQASEKAWGAVAHYVKSVAKVRGWSDGSHRDIAENARKLLDRTPDPHGNRDKFSHINLLHINFYEEVFDPEDVERGIRHARVLIDAMRGGGVETADTRAAVEGRTVADGRAYTDGAGFSRCGRP